MRSRRSSGQRARAARSCSRSPAADPAAEEPERLALGGLAGHGAQEVEVAALVGLQHMLEEERSVAALVGQLARGFAGKPALDLGGRDIEVEAAPGDVEDD